MIFARISLGLVLILSLLNCQSSKQLKKEHSKKEIRHGWTVVNTPSRSIVDVNDKGSLTRGKKLYQIHCAKCHGQDGKGDGDLARMLGINPANLRELGKKTPNYMIVMQINKGATNMPRWEDKLSTSESWDLSNFIRSLNK